MWPQSLHFALGGEEAMMVARLDWQSVQSKMVQSAKLMIVSAPEAPFLFRFSPFGYRTHPFTPVLKSIDVAPQRQGVSHQASSVQLRYSAVSSWKLAQDFGVKLYFPPRNVGAY